MKKKIAKILGLIIVFMAVGSFLYSRRYTEYEWNAQEAVDQQEQLGVLDEYCFPKHYEREVSDKLRFDVEVDPGNFSGEEPYLTAQATRASIDPEKVYDYFMSEKKEISPVVYENYSDQDGNSIPITVYADDSCSLSVSTADFFYTSETMSYIHNAFYPDTSTAAYNGDLYSIDSNLNFMDRNAAWLQIYSAMEKTGLDMEGAISRITYSLDLETLKDEELCIDVNGNICEEEKNVNWTENDEGYYYYIAQSWEGIPFYDSMYIDEDEITNASLEIYQTGEGIEAAYLNQWFEIQPLQEEKRLADFEQIMKTVEEKYTGTIRTNPLVVEKATLYLFTVETNTKGVYSLEPVWICTLAEDHVVLGENRYTSKFWVPIHAVTAEEMYVVET